MVFSIPLSQLTTVISSMPRQLSELQLEQSVTGFTTDSRSLQPGQLFVALEGERFNGHDFVAQAIAQGAPAAVVRRGVIDGSIPRLEVEDTLTAYQSLGRWWRQQLAIPVVAITGSVGKTTTKELIAAAIATQASVLKTKANFNNEIGVPKTLLELDPSHDYAVVEMGMRGPGEIALLTQIAQPDVALITNVGTAHIGRLGSEQAIANAKCELLAELRPEGIAVLNYDNDRLIKTAAQVWTGRQITYGLTGGDICGRLLDATTLEVAGVSLPLPLPGRHNALNLLAAIATLQALDLDWQRLADGFSVEMPAGRSRRYQLSEDILILDETYNAGFESMTAALQLLADQPAQRRIAVLGTMKELGDHSAELHWRVGAAAQALGIDRLLILADPEAAAALSEGAGTMVHQQFSTQDALLTELKQSIQPGDRLLFKASRSVGLDQVVDRLVSELQNDSPALV